MPYATQAEFEDKFGTELTIELTNLENPSAVAVDTDVFGRSQVDGDALIDSYLAVRYALPLSSNPPILRLIALDIYRYLLAHNANEADVRQRYEDALRMLQQIANGTLKLAVEEIDDAAAVGAPAYSAPERTFTVSTSASRGTLEGYV